MFEKFQVETEGFCCRSLRSFKQRLKVNVVEVWEVSSRDWSFMLKALFIGKPEKKIMVTVNNKKCVILF